MGSFLLFSEEGYRPVSPEELLTPYKISISQGLSQITLLDVLRALEDLAKELCPILGHGQDLHLSIRSEKHGPFYHVCSAGNDSGPFLGFLIASTKRSKEVLASDMENLAFLRRVCGPYFPQVFHLAELEVKGLHFLVGLVEWLNGYYEVHARKRSDGITFELWAENGILDLHLRDVFNFFKVCAGILLRCYGCVHNNRIANWTHITGDFIYNPKQEGYASVHLTTVRALSPYNLLPEDPYLRSIYSDLLFLLELFYLNRVDKDRGVGELLLLPDIAIQATLKALVHETEINKKLDCALRLMKKMNEDELALIYEALIPQLEFPEEISKFLFEFVEYHVWELVRAIRVF